MIPILVPAPKAKATAVLFLDGLTAYGRELPENALQVFTDQHCRSKFEREFGSVPESLHAGVRAALLLMQAIETGDPQRLNDYASWQAVAEVKAEQELIEKLKPLLESAPGVLEAMRSVVSSQRDKTHADEKSELAKRMSSGHPLMAVSELLLQLNRWIRRARFLLYFERPRGKVLPGLYCPDVGTGLAALTFDRIPSSYGVGTCRRCGKIFLRMRLGQNYHSLQCGNADRKARERAQKRGKAK